MKSLFSKLLTEKRGATAIEYGLIAALIAVVIIVAVTAVGQDLQTTFTTVSDNLPAGAAPAPAPAP